MTTRVLGTRAVRAAVEDAGLTMSDVDGCSPTASTTLRHPRR